jgi:glutaredoxin
MKLIRWFLGKIILLLNAIFAPKAVERGADDQRKLDEETKHFALYQFETCPFCVKVRRAIKRMGLKIEIRDILKVTAFEEELIKNGGQRQVPCLKISNRDGSVRWLYESSDIIAFLTDLVGAPSKAKT